MELGAQGHSVALHYRTGERDVQQIQAALTAKGITARAFHADLIDDGQIRTMTKEIRKSLGPVQILVNNAGFYARAKLESLTTDMWEKTLKVHLSGAFHCTQGVVPGMKEAGWGRIVNIASQIAFRGTPHGSDYAAAKGGLVGFTKALAMELAPFGITVNCVAPGAIETDIIVSDTPQQRAERNRGIPLGRVGRPEEIAKAVAYLCSEQAGYVTGTTLHVNGGVVMI